MANLDRLASAVDGLALEASKVVSALAVAAAVDPNADQPALDALAARVEEISASLTAALPAPAAE